MCALTSSVEHLRLATLRRYRILDSAPEQSFDDLTMTAAVACRTAAAFISFIDGDRLWFKSTFGFTRDEISRGFAFCDDVLESGDLMVVEDSLADRRYADSPLVTGPPHARFYAWVPLTTADGAPWTAGPHAASTRSTMAPP